MSVHLSVCIHSHGLSWTVWYKGSKGSGKAIDRNRFVWVLIYQFIAHAFLPGSLIYEWYKHKNKSLVVSLCFSPYMHRETCVPCTWSHEMTYCNGPLLGPKGAWREETACYLCNERHEKALLCAVWVSVRPCKINYLFCASARIAFTHIQPKTHSVLCDSPSHIRIGFLFDTKQTIYFTRRKCHELDS